MDRALSSALASTPVASTSASRAQPHRALRGAAPTPRARPSRVGGIVRGRNLAVQAVGQPQQLATIFREEVCRRGLDEINLLGDALSASVTPSQKLCCPSTQGAIWQQVISEALREAEIEPQLAGLLHSSIVSHDSLGKAMAFVLANKLSSAVLLSNTLLELFQEAFRSDPALVTALYVDLQAVMDRDPACQRYIQPVLFFKGYQSLQAYRLAHHFWVRGRQMLAIALQSQISQTFAVDIHPAARIGTGILIDHATGVVIGETAVVGNNVSILHHVTLGGTGSGRGDRHPKIGDGVLIGAGASILGNITVGESSKIGAGSVVLSDVPPHSTAVGVPARAMVRKAKPAEEGAGSAGAGGSGSTLEDLEPALLMDQTLDDWLSFDWVI